MEVEQDTATGTANPEGDGTITEEGCGSTQDKAEVPTNAEERVDVEAKNSSLEQSLPSTEDDAAPIVAAIVPAENVPVPQAEAERSDDVAICTET